MSFDSIARRAFAPVEQLIDALSDPKSERITLICVLAAYWAIWSAYAIVAHSSIGIHTDMAEVATWSWNLEWGTPKHPPLLPALVRVWFSVLPESDWAYYVLAALSATVAIYFSWLLAGFWLRGPKRAAVPFLLMLVPFYNFLALRFDHNAVLIPLWAITTYAFIKSFQTKSIPWSVVAGVAAGLAMLAKYWSLGLLLGLGLAAIIDSRRLEYLKSPAPWIITAVSFCLFLPHLLWLNTNEYAVVADIVQRSIEPWPVFWMSLLKYIMSFIGYFALPMLLVTVLTAPSIEAIRDALLPRDRERRFAALLFWLPFVVTILIALWMHSRLVSVWTMCMLSLLGVMMLSSPLLQFNRRSAAIVATLAIAISIGSLLASPFVAYRNLMMQSGSPYTRLIAAEVQKQWDQIATTPVRLFASINSLANPVAYYLDNKVRPIGIFAPTPARWSTPESVNKLGVVTVCPAASAGCQSKVESMFGQQTKHRVEANIVPQWLGFSGVPQDFVINIAPPATRNQAANYCCISAVKRKRPLAAYAD